MAFDGIDLKGLFSGRNSETLIVGLSIIGMFSALAAGADPAWTVGAGFGIPFVYCGYRLLMVFVKNAEAKAATRELAVNRSRTIFEGRATDAEIKALEMLSQEGSSGEDLEDGRI